MSELYKFAYHLTRDTECVGCGTEFDFSGIKFGPSQTYYDLEASYECPSCSKSYRLFVEDNGHNICFDVYQEGQNVDEDFGVHTQVQHKASLHKELHEARSLIDGLGELENALTILSVNEERITDAVEELESALPLETPSELQQRIEADIHNYLASAYSFKQILETVRGELPTGGPVEANLERFEEEHRVISGLRTYVQHYQTLPTGYTQYYNEELGETRISATVRLEKIDEIEADKDRHPPDGYAHDEGADYHYGQIEGDLIDLELRTASHFDAAESLVESLRNHATDVREDELSDYFEKTDFSQYHDI